MYNLESASEFPSYTNGQVLSIDMTIKKNNESQNVYEIASPFWLLNFVFEAVTKI
jgi:hypothetical protein